MLPLARPEAAEPLAAGALQAAACLQIWLAVVLVITAMPLIFPHANQLTDAGCLVRSTARAGAAIAVAVTAVAAVDEAPRQPVAPLVPRPCGPATLAMPASLISCVAADAHGHNDAKYRKQQQSINSETETGQSRYNTNKQGGAGAAAATKGLRAIVRRRSDTAA